MILHIINSGSNPDFSTLAQEAQMDERNSEDV
jgi:hypothetical protein